MKCPECQFDNREVVKFCEECGAKLELKCPNCKAEISLGRKFCGECGHKLIEPSEAPVVDFSEPQSYTPNSGSWSSSSCYREFVLCTL